MKTTELSDLRSTSHVIVGAHPDDVELIGLSAIFDSDASVTAVVCTDGRGGPRARGFEDLSEPQFAALRRAEQLEAAERGGYEQLVMLDFPSEVLRSDRGAVSARLYDIMSRVRPATVLTHNPVDMHQTHVRTCQAVVEALRAAGHVPAEFLGVEVWRDLDWLAPDRRVVIDVSGAEQLSMRLLGAFKSQLEGKRYDLAAAGRRRAHATFANPYANDEISSAMLALDLLPTLREGQTIEDLVVRHLDEFRAVALAALDSDPGRPVEPAGG